MESIVFITVIVAAMLHASWNALVKGNQNKYLSMTAVVLGHLPIALVILPFVPFPTPDSWPYLFFGIFLHVGYQLFLLASYKQGDFTQVYPIARGFAPLLVAGILVLFLGINLSNIELLAILIIGAGVMSLSLVRYEDGMRNYKATIFALITGGFIAGYSIVDGLGARLSGSALGFYVWLTLGNAVLFAVFMRIKQPGIIRQIPKQAKRVFILGGSASFIAYALVMWSFTQAPIPIVTALRETSIIFALLIGTLFLNEKINLAKVASTMMTLAGVALLRFSKS